MTAQIGEILIYNNEEYFMQCEPLYYYLIKLKKKAQPKMPMRNTACWRGYVGKWEIKDNKLFLVDITIHSLEKELSNIGYIFKENKEIFASWFTGQLVLPQGEMLEYVHAGYESVFEKELLLKIENGVFIESEIVDNREKPKAELSQDEKERVKDIEKTFDDILNKLKK
jgi:hypothetical protein